VLQSSCLRFRERIMEGERGKRRVGVGLAGMGTEYHVLGVVRNLNWRLLKCKILYSF
jgi:hypothetical protein